MELIGLGYVAVTLFGLVFGSFAGATVWRLRARQLIEDKAAGEPVDAKELKRLKPLTKSTLKSDRSQCLHCHHELAWYDLLPLVSWLSTKGRCRYCKKLIGRFEPLMELGMAAAFLVFYHYWISLNGQGVIGLLIFWLIIIVMLGILLAYDLKWFLLPDRVMFPLIALAAAYAGFIILTAGAPSFAILATVNAVISVAILSGLYLVLWLVSKGAWVGFGDVKLGLALGLLLMNWKLALLTLFLANLIGTLVILPGLITGKLSRGTQVPFGPLLIVGFFISVVGGQAIIDGYQTFSIWLTTTLLML